MPPPCIAITAPEDISSGTLTRWLKRPGDPVAQHEPVAEVDTDKAAVEIHAPESGILEAQHIVEGAEVPPGSAIAAMRVVAMPSSRPSEIRASPGVRRAWAAAGRPAVAGQGPEGRVTRAEVMRAIDAEVAPSGEDVRLVPHTLMRRQIAERVSHATAVAPHVTAVFEADFTAVLARRRALISQDPEAWTGLTVLPFLVMASVRALRLVPEANATWETEALKVHRVVHIGFATALGEHGLIIPVVRRADTYDLRGMMLRTLDLTARARARALRTEDVSGGTFTISNHGASGSLLATPIILNQMQTATLGVGKIERRVIVVDSEGLERFEARSMAYVSLTIDHRVLDAWHTNRWLSCLVGTLENWSEADERGAFAREPRQ